MTRTELRDEHLNNFYWWKTRNPDKAREHAIARQLKHQAETLEHATRADTPWTEHEMRAAHEADDVKAFALEHGRTYKAVVAARQRYRKMHGIKANRLKPEHVEYNSKGGWG